jgi:hypothetical protein
MGCGGRSCLLANHGTIVQQTPVIIGKLDRDQRSGVRDQKKNGLGSSERPGFALRGLDISSDGGRDPGFGGGVPQEFLSPAKAG